MKKWGILAIVLLALMVFAGCGSAAATPPVDAVEDEVEESILTPVIGARALEDGRRVGGTAKASLGEALTNVFFTFSVEGAAFVDEYEGVKAERGFQFLVAEINVTNIDDEALPMWANDFVIQWGDGANDYGYPIAHFANTQMEDAYTLEPGAGLTTDVVYEIPYREGENEYNISYLEFFEDGTEGNTFYVIFSLSMER